MALVISNLNQSKNLTKQVQHLLETNSDIGEVYLETYSACGVNTVKALRALVQGLEYQKHIQILHIAFAQFDCVKAHYVSQCLTVLKNVIPTLKVETLDLSGCQLGLCTLKELADFIERLPRSVLSLNLSLNFNETSQYSLEELARVLASSQRQIQFDYRNRYIVALCEKINQLSPGRAFLPPSVRRPPSFLDHSGGNRVEEPPTSEAFFSSLSKQ